VVNLWDGAPNSGRHAGGFSPLDRALIVIIALLLPLLVGIGIMHATAPERGRVPAYEDERWQDPSGHPYCTYPDDMLRPCVEAQTGIVRWTEES
jgi:hypothetical protein